MTDRIRVVNRTICRDRHTGHALGTVGAQLTRLRPVVRLDAGPRRSRWNWTGRGQHSEGRRRAVSERLGRGRRAMVDPRGTGFRRIAQPPRRIPQPIGSPEPVAGRDRPLTWTVRIARGSIHDRSVAGGRIGRSGPSPAPCAEGPPAPRAANASIEITPMYVVPLLITSRSSGPSPLAKRGASPSRSHGRHPGPTKIHGIRLSQMAARSILPGQHAARVLVDAS